ncbi:MAG: carbamate kinase [Candidatus Neomarinimicrobiota bacterium]
MNLSSPKTAVVALGGNAISPMGETDSLPNQFRHTRESLVAVIHLIKSGYELAITHGNAPQVGNALLRTELTADTAPLLPLYICVADIQGGMGYMIEQCLQNVLKRSGIRKDVVTMITQVLIDENDPEVVNPTKYVGQRYDEDAARRLADRFGWQIRRTSAGDWRRVVPSPLPISIIESGSIKELTRAGKIVVAAGGGGIPVHPNEDGSLEGFDAVVDKDLASAILAHEIGATEFFILTDVDGVALNFGQRNEEWLSELTVNESRRFLEEGHFPPGSMGPKITAAINFLEKGGNSVLITSIRKIREALKGESGTVIRD